MLLFGEIKLFTVMHTRVHKHAHTHTHTRTNKYSPKYTQETVRVKKMKERLGKEEKNSPRS